MILLLSDTTWIALTIGILFVLGVCLFFLSGFLHIKKGYCAIIEKVGNFVGVYEEGWHYFFPLFYRRVAMYQKKPYVRQVTVGKFTIELSILVQDPKAYYYSGKNFLDILQESAKKDWGNLQDYVEAVQEQLQAIGVCLVRRGK